jgi:DNA-binding winged helix-turn-helix (wHTH) protein
LPEYRIGEFLLDPDERLLRRNGERLDLSGRYLDALVLLVRERGKLISKERFHEEVWRGVPVTDEALTQCIRSLRRLLDDKAEQPRFIETVPRHGYRFIAAAEEVRTPAAPAPVRDAPLINRRASKADLAWLLGAGVVGAGVAGMVGGLVYGLAGASSSDGPAGMGTVSVVLVLLCVSILTAVLGGLGVAGGLVAAEHWQGRINAWIVAGGAAGGLLVGTVTKLLGLDAFNLLLGKAPTQIAGGLEGALMGSGVGLAAWLAARHGLGSARRAALFGAGAGAAAGLLIGVLGGRLMAGSLDALARTMPASRLRLDQLGNLLGEPAFGPLSRVITATAEGALFATCIVAAMTVARRQRRRA